MRHRRLNVPQPILAWLATCYSFAVRVRLALYRTGYLKPNRLDAKTISVGNISVGGTGKTPLVERLARYFSQRDYSVAILTRGYGRKHPRRRQVISDGQRILDDVRAAGDEPLMLAKHLPGVRVIADPDRHAAGKWAEGTFGIDLHILDDAFQHLGLERDVNLVVIDALDPFGGEQPLPLGRLREPLSELARASAIVVTQADRPFDQTGLEMKLKTLAGDKPIFYAYRDLTGLFNPIIGETVPPQRLINRPIATLCAIGQPAYFLDDMRHFQARIVYHRAFPDHHYFSPAEIDRVFARARKAGADWVLTTEKDWMRIQPLDLPSEPILWVVKSEMRVIEEAQLLSFILRKIEA